VIRSEPPAERIVTSPATGGASELDVPAAVLFDLDGTLVDTEPVWEVGLHELAARYGATLDAAVRERMVGSAAGDTMRLLLDHVGQPWRDPEEGATWLEQRMVELLAEGVVWRPGARELLDAVAEAGIPAALVTNTRRMLVEVLLETVGRARFAAVVCGDEVVRTKPDPEPYLTAAAKLGVPAEVCVAIEDSPTGIASAVAAGCAVLAVPSQLALRATDQVSVVPTLANIDIRRLAELLDQRR
jgi:HAD superfamily hydrolase (TIGR01509 family)